MRVARVVCGRRLCGGGGLRRARRASQDMALAPSHTRTPLSMQPFLNDGDEGDEKVRRAARPAAASRPQGLRG
jgi:hypothetical protein